MQCTGIEFQVLRATTAKCRIFWYNVMQFGRSPPTFRNNLLSPTVGLNSKPTNKPAKNRGQAEIFPDVGGGIFLRNIGELPLNSTSLQPRRLYSARRNIYILTTFVGYLRDALRLGACKYKRNIWPYASVFCKRIQTASRHPLIS
jgi:hypothetical protein